MADILVIEPSRPQRDLLARRLAQGGHWVVTATDGAQGLIYARTAQFDLIVLDMDAPELAGLDLARHLKAARSTAQTPLLALIAPASKEQRKQYLAAGCDDWVPKPVDLAQLQAKIRALCVRAPAPRPRDACGLICS